MYDIFISYKREDRSQAHLLAEALVAHGLKVWWDIELLPGDKFADEISAIIKKSRATIVLWSENSVKSNFVKAEASLALKSSHLIPLRLDQCDLPLPFGEIHTLDISDWKGELDSSILSNILQSIEKFVGYIEPETRDSKEVNVLLTKPEDEAEYWKEISESAGQNIEEYELYLSKFGEGALFHDIAELRILAIKREKRISITKIIAFATAILTLVVLGSQVYQMVRSQESESDHAEISIDENNNELLVPNNSKTIIMDSSYDPTKYIIANQIIITNNTPSLERGTVLIANEIQFSSKSILSGVDLTVITVKIVGGKISSSGIKAGESASNLLLVASKIEGTIVEANGANGENGVNGNTGSNGSRGSNGRSGNCNGFGAWQPAQAGGTGANGGNGTDGGDGQNGGNGGNILLLVENVPALLPVATGGKGGKGGLGGVAGQGGPGGQGGSGCTGLGGSQPTKANGTRGLNGRPGRSGKDGNDGKAIKPIVKSVNFDTVTSIVAKENDVTKIIEKLRSL